MSERWTFADPTGGKYRIEISGAAIAKLVSECAFARTNETGGILVGRYSKDGWTAEVQDVSRPPDGSSAGSNWFHRGITGLAHLLTKRWAKGEHYVGEWHYHPGGRPTPSGTDIASMRSISINKSYQCPEPILVILGGSPPTRWELSAGVFAYGQFTRLERELTN